AARRHVCRPRADRHPAARDHRRARPEGRPGGSPGTHGARRHRGGVELGRGTAGITRRPMNSVRRCLALATALTLGVAIAAPAGAGEQRYEPLSASVKTALHRSVADRASPRHAWFSTDEGT